jgi:SAM-dependent methyltransferase
VGLGLFLLSASSLAFEVTLTHLFSLVFQYHFAFLAISSAILGLGVGAILHYRLPANGKIQDWLSPAAGLVALAMSLAVSLFSLLGFVPGIAIQAIIGALPFVAVGFFSACLYTVYHKKAAWLYAFDLGGAGVGLLGILLLLNWMSATTAGFVLCLLAATTSLLYAGLPRKRPALPFIALGVALSGLVFNLTTHFFDLPSATLDAIPLDKTMFRLLADPTSGSKLLDSAWSSFARVDLISSSDPNQEYIFTNGGAGSYMLRFDSDLSKVQSLTQELEYLPFYQFKADKTLILGAGAGKDVLQALLAGSQYITAVEINPAMVALTRQNASFNGKILDYPGVQTVVADARNFIERSSDTYDMIYLNLVYAQAPTPGSNALSESYIFTTQAFQSYWQHLTPDGRLGIITHQGLEGTRALMTALKALELDGIPIKDALQHIALLMYNSSDPNQNTTIMVLQKSPLNPAQVQLFEQASLLLNLQPLFLPGSYEVLLESLASGSMTLDDYVAKQDYNLFPTNDDSPFFFNLNPGLPKPLVTLLITASMALVGYLFLMETSRNRPAAWHLVFFGGLGMGYILIEVPLIQRTLLLVGSPTLAMVVVLATLLLSGGIGSFLSSRWGADQLWLKLSLATLLVTLLASLMAFFQPNLVAALGNLPVGLVIVLGSLLLVPLGLLMGIPFANGLRLAGIRDQNSLAYLWGWNAITTVSGAALAAGMAIWVDYRAGMLLGAGCYLAVAVASWMLARGN